MMMEPPSALHPVEVPSPGTSCPQGEPGGLGQAARGKINPRSLQEDGLLRSSLHSQPGPPALRSRCGTQGKEYVVYLQMAENLINCFTEF
ncbi:hypothetical protein VULLAG_LOCUS3754 [Vulpes lagopus]